MPENGRGHEFQMLLLHKQICSEALRRSKEQMYHQRTSYEVAVGA